MKLPLQISFRDIEHSAEIEALVREKARRLDKFAPDIMICRVVIGLAGRHRRHGNQYDVRIDLTLPGEEIAVSRGPGEHAQYRDVAVELRDAFDAARRKVEDYVRRQRADVKAHEPRPQARVGRLFPDEDYGFLETRDGREIYFTRASVVGGDFTGLRTGDAVTYVETAGDKGPQASTVRRVGGARADGAR